ncbi:MAG: DUF362 domain-containing protein [Candidatus Eisenbacteria bacterium]|nr:DUF362 domain-containing protein [Candidatus Eisenbacteria bacterium]
MSPPGTSHPIVSIARGPAGYPVESPYNPDTRWPEYPAELPIGTEANPVYTTVREALRLLGLDAARFGMPSWNPLAEVIQPGQTVVIKPNFVLSDHYRGGNPFSVVTHPAVLRAVLDYVWLATTGKGRIIIADTPQLDCDFEQLMDRSRLPVVTELYQRVFGADIPIRDLRHAWFRYEGENYFASQANRRVLPGDPDGSTKVDLGSRSAFYAVGSRAYYGADFNREETQAHHSGGRHDYMVSNTILGADVLISVPKLKVHKKVGVTLNAKGLVGTVTNKNYLIHYALGGEEAGGDQYPSNVLSSGERALMKLQRFLYDRLLARKDRLGNRIFLAIYNPFRRLVRPLIRRSTEKINMFDGGNWHGNDSAWRMVSDLMTIARFADRNGVIQATPQRRHFSLVDGIVGGEGNGPLFPDARPVGVILAGESFLAVDAVAARLMGFDPRKLPWMSDLMGSVDRDFHLRNLSDIDVRSAEPGWSELFKSKDPALAFKPHPGWAGHIEWHGSGD